MTIREILEDFRQDTREARTLAEYDEYKRSGEKHTANMADIAKYKRLALDQAESQIKAWIEETIIGSDLPLEQPGDEKLSTIDRAVWVTFRKGANWAKESQRQQLREEK